MYIKRISVYARFQWLNHLQVVYILKTFLKPPARGRKGYDKVWLFRWLIYKHLMGCSYRDLESMTDVDYSTFIKFRKRLIRERWFERIFTNLSRVIGNMLPQISAIIDSSFVETYSRRAEAGSEYFGYKQKNGFKLHQMIDHETRVPLVQYATGGARSDIVWGGHLIRGSPASWNIRELTADRAYDGAYFVKEIAQKWNGVRIGIPLRRHKPHDGWFNVFMKSWDRTLTSSVLHKRSEIERYFSRKKRVFNLGEERTRGLENFEAHCSVTSIMEILEWSTTPQILCIIHQTRCLTVFNNVALGGVYLKCQREVEVIFRHSPRTSLKRSSTSIALVKLYNRVFSYLNITTIVHILG